LTSIYSGTLNVLSQEDREAFRGIGLE